MHADLLKRVRQKEYGQHSRTTSSSRSSSGAGADDGGAVDVHVQCPFMAFSLEVDEQLTELAWRVDAALELAPPLRAVAERVVGGLGKVVGNGGHGGNEMGMGIGGPSPYVALHLRVETDWLTHCAAWEAVRDGRARDNCMRNTLRLAAVFKEEGVPPDMSVYVAGGTDGSTGVAGTEGAVGTYTKAGRSDPLTALGQTRRLYVRSDFIDTDVPLPLPSLVSSNSSSSSSDMRDVWAAVDAYVCAQSALFVGNSVSTFSALSLLRRRRLMLPAWHYNYGAIPLEESLPYRTADYAPFLAFHPPTTKASTSASTSISSSASSTDRPLTWVFTLYFTHDMDESFLEMAKGLCIDLSLPHSRIHTYTHTYTRTLTHILLHTHLHAHFTHTLTHALTHSLTHSLTRSITRPLAHSPTRPLAHSPTRPLARIPSGRPDGPTPHAAGGNLPVRCERRRDCAGTGHARRAYAGLADRGGCGDGVPCAGLEVSYRGVTACTPHHAPHSLQPAAYTLQWRLTLFWSPLH